MARARGGLHKAPAVSTPRRSTRRTGTLQHAEDVPAVFQDLLSEAAAEEARPLKKRKTRHDVGTPAPAPGAVPPQTNPSEPSSKASLQAQSQKPPPQAPPVRSPSPSARDQRNRAQSQPSTRQTIVDSDESDDSDMEWEDALADGGDSDTHDEPVINDISVTIGAQDDIESKTKRQVRRRAITAVDKRRRLDIHKWHAMCLLYHVHRRNAWCNDRIVQATVRNVLSAKVLANLVPDPNLSQFQASKQFLAGIGDLKMLWSKRFTATAKGMCKPRWVDTDAEVRPFSDFDEFDDPMDLDDFRAAASKLEGSQDVGAQLFCALIRGVGLEARLVCSLQCLPFASAAQPSTPQKPDTIKNTITLDPYNTQSLSPPKPIAAASSRKSKSRLERALGERHPALSTGVAPRQRKKYHTEYPVYWVEVFNNIHQKWVPVDPLSTFTINQPEKLEPPLNSAHNTLTYAIAFDDDYTAKDVTRRYTKAYNAKTRKFRVESTQRGESWWEQVMGFWKRKPELDRDQVEDAALTRKEAAEGIPKAVQDFKDHPVYVLERHLRHNEVIYPLNQVGKVNVGSSFKPKMEPIYRRKDVHLVRSADKWYRLGKDVQDGEQPLKHAKPKKGRRLSIGPDTTVEDQEDDIGAGLYAEYQTSIYIPPPVVRGRVPRNAYGNLDLYVPSMCPPGGRHIRHKLASKAARIVGVDYAEAITGFKFKGRHGTAVVQGVVVAQEYAEAVEAVIEGLEYSLELVEEQNRTAEAMRLWRRFFLGLKIVQRINGQDYGDETPQVDVQKEVEQEDKHLKEEAFAGGFFPDEGESKNLPVRCYEPHSQDEDHAGGFDGGFDREEDEDASGGFVPDGFESHPRGLEREASQNFGSAILSQQQLLPRRQSSFLVLEDDDDYGGGFLRDSPPPKASKSTCSPDLKGNFVQQDDPVDPNGGFLPDVRLERPEIDMPSEKIEPQPIEADVHTEPDKPKNTVLEGNGVQSVFDETGIVTKLAEPSLPTSSLSDAGSLPLEDPDDEDAEPDWLMDDT
ncbi:Rad4-domain-containing protein [Karstenula rhodostoma CBS 690.94]|uniref:Rad4-domain-containing protein n=1 Tax=Karstenula rhodostoma CBS 690.94 TaxID=1392251 RepID=A0A9P4PS38_9PLEO|nr:Rad4-domain-containing protein [Karstenula rhodostoma CBS 690.94]